MSTPPTITPAGWLDGDRVTLVRASPARMCDLAEPKPTGVVHHWTGSLGTTDRHAVLLADNWRQGGGPSAHVIVSRSGRIVQCVPFSRGAHHCRGANETAVGLELENAGVVELFDGALEPVENPHRPRDEWRPMRWGDRRQVRRLVPVRDTAERDGTRYHTFTPQQVAAVEALLRALVAWGCPLTAESCSRGHCDFEPERKRDPGPIWLDEHLPSILARVFGAAACGTP